MTDEQKAAYVMAQAAIMNATVTGMIAENYTRMSRGESLAYGEEAFQELINNSGIHHNACITLFHGG